jgi:hypothetical protein
LRLDRLEAVKVALYANVGRGVRQDPVNCEAARRSFSILPPPRPLRVGL